MYLYIALTAWNLLVFILYGLDKRRAIQGRFRIPERALLICALFLGGIGAFAGARFFRHKTKKLVFRICLPLNFILTIGFAIWLAYQI